MQIREIYPPLFFLYIFNVGEKRLVISGREILGVFWEGHFDKNGEVDSYRQSKCGSNTNSYPYKKISDTNDGFRVVNLTKMTVFCHFLSKKWQFVTVC